MFKRIVKSISGHSLTRFRLIRSFYFFLLSHLRDTKSFVYVLGNKMFLDSIDSLGLSIRGEYEPFETLIIQREVKEGDTVLDLGANIGYYTLIFAKIVGEKGKVFSFEPDPTNFSLLSRNVEINGFKNVTLVQKAVSNENGKCNLYLRKYNKGAHTTIKDLDKDCGIISVGTTRLDDYFKKNDKIDFVKMDIEGAEGRAIQGMSNILQKNKNIKILTEFNHKFLEKSGIKSEEYFKMLAEFGFKIYCLDEQKNKVEMIASDDLIKRYIDGGYTNLFCKR